MTSTHCHAHPARFQQATRFALVLLLAILVPLPLLAATIAVDSTASNRGTFTELQCLPPGSDVDVGAPSGTVTGGATLATAQADGVVTLREAICVANNTPGADVITLTQATYTLSEADNYWYGPNGLPPIGDDITIEGNGAVIERNPANFNTVLSQRFRFFFVSRRTLTDGIAIVGGVDRARLTLRDLSLRNGLAQGGSAQSGGGGAGMGGAIFNQGFLALERVTLQGNVARGGDSGLNRGGSTFEPYFGRGGGMGTDAFDGGGFGPGQFGGAPGGSSLFAANALIYTYGCGGGAGFGLAAGGDATVRAFMGASILFAGEGGGLGNVGGSTIPLCLSDTDCSGQGRDGGGGGVGDNDSTSGDGSGGSFGQGGGEASECGGGGGVGGGGGEGSWLTGLNGGAGGFGAGGGSRFIIGINGSLTLAVGGNGGFGGGGAGGFNPDGDQVGTNGLGGFGGGDGGTLFIIPSGGGGAGLGGALFNHGGLVVVQNTTWHNNRAIGGSVILQNFSIAGAGMGGAIFNLDGTLDIGFSTLSGNRAYGGAASQIGLRLPAGGAIYNRVQNPGVYGFAPSVSVRNSILANSLDGASAPISDCNHSAHPDAGVTSALAVSESSVFETLAFVNDWDASPACASGPGSMLVDPQLEPLADNGGSTRTHALLPDSVAVDAASDCGASIDQRGIARPQGSACDIGAFELEQTTLATPTVTAIGGTFDYDGNAHAGSCTVTGTNGEDLGALAATYTPAGPPLNAGDYTVHCDFPGNEAYIAASSTAALTIRKANAVIVVTGYDVTYDANPHTATGSATGLGGLDLSSGLVLTGTTHTTADDYSDSWSFTSPDPNYKNAAGTVRNVIAKATPAVSALGGSFTYDTLPHAGTCTVTGVVNEVLGPLSPGYSPSPSPFSAPTAAGVYTVLCNYPGNRNYTAASATASITIAARPALVSYIGQQNWVTSGASATTAQVTLSASVQDPTGVALVGAKMDFVDAGTGRVLAAGVPVAAVANATIPTGTANAVVTLGSGQYGAESYLIMVVMTGNYTNAAQAADDKTATLTVAKPASTNQTIGAGTIAALATAAGTYKGNGDDVTFTVGLSYNKSGSNLQGKATLVVPQADGVLVVKSNAISSMTVSSKQGVRYSTIYTKASISKVLSNATVVTLEGNVTLRIDSADGGTDQIGLTVLSTKDSTMFYSNQWLLDGNNTWRTALEALKSGSIAIQ